METGPHPRSLAARNLFAIADASSVRILCTAGRLWITVDNDSRDFVLEPGESFETAQRERAVVYALLPSRLLVAPQPQGSMRRSAAKNSSDCSRSPSVWAATRAARSG